jgi:uncharacterized protein YndB with AHSA1/START domain
MNETKALTHSLERTVEIRATREIVFRYFTDSERFAAWWGPGSRIEPRPGGAVHIRYPNQAEASGTVVEISPPERIVFTYGYEGADPMFPPGGSRVTVTLEEIARGTRLTLRHELPTEAARNHHVQGWRYQLALFANVASREANAGAAEVADRFFATWSEPDAARRRQALAALATQDLEFGDAFSATRGRDDLVEHIGGAQVFMPGMTMRREGAPRLCQGTALVDWSAVGPDGSVRGRGTNVFEFTPDGRIARVLGFWAG